MTTTDEVSEVYRERGRPLRSRNSGLTPSEVSVMRALANGRTNMEIGIHLNIDEATVRTHVSRGYAKLSVNNRIDAMCAVLEGALD